MADGTWTAADAKARFGEVVERARSEGPQRVTRNGREAVVVISAEAYRDLSSRPVGWQGKTLTEVLFDPAIRGLSEEEHERAFGRSKEPPRPVDL